MDSSVSIANRYGRNGPGMESRWRRDIPQPSRPAQVAQSLLYKEYGVFPGCNPAGAWR